MTVTIKEVISKSDLKAFATFDHTLYKGNPYFVPSLIYDEINLLDSKKNPAFDFCEAAYFLAYRKDRIVGRIGAFINHRANEKWKENKARFGFVDFIDDEEVSKALFERAEGWAKGKGTEIIHGPLGFTDLDKEGLLIEGFDQLSTMSALYNAPYYQHHIEKLGYKADADWVEYKIFIPEAVPEKHKRISEIVIKKYGLTIKKFKSGKQLVKEYGQAIFDLINESYEPLYGYVALTQKQIDYYVKTYLPMLNLDFVTLIVDQQNQLIGVGITMPSLSRALQKSGGKLFPFGFIPLAKALLSKKAKVVDLLLVAVKPEFQNKGINALLFYDLIPAYNKAGVEYGESNPELVMNERVQAQWEYFKTQQHKRRRAYYKRLK